MAKKKLKVEIDLDLLKRIAEYYEFPLAVFFSNKRAFNEKTRKKSLFKRMYKFKKEMNELFEKYFD